MTIHKTVFAVLLLACAARADQKDLLKGLRGVSITVACYQQDLSNEILSDMEVKLRAARLKVLDSNAATTPDLQAMVLPADGGGFFVRAELREPGQLVNRRVPLRGTVTTWHSLDSYVSYLNKEDIRRAVEDAVQQFLSDWIEAEEDRIRITTPGQAKP